MKKQWMLIFCMALMTLFGTGTAGATDVPAVNSSVAVERFQPIVINDKVSTALDTQTICYAQDPYRDEKLLDAWIKTKDRENGGYNLSRYYFRIKERQYQLIASLEFDADGNILSTERNGYSVKAFKDVIPETLAENWYNAVLQYEKDHLATKR